MDHMFDSPALQYLPAVTFFIVSSCRLIEKQFYFLAIQQNISPKLFLECIPTFFVVVFVPKC